MPTVASLLVSLWLSSLLSNAAGEAVPAAQPKYLRSTAAPTVSALSESPSGTDAEFQAFKQNFGKTYGSQEEESARFQRFQATQAQVRDLNARNRGIVAFGMGHSADFFQEELDTMFSSGHVLSDEDDLASIEVAQRGGPLGRRLMQLPPVLNWAVTKAVTAIKTQGGCGACWAFSVAEAVESMYILYVDHGFQEVFSPQQIASCADSADGCGGGSTIAAYLYLMSASTTGLSQEVFWPYMQGLTPQTACQHKTCTHSCRARNLSDIATYQPLIGPYAEVTNAKFAIPPCTSNSSCDNQDLDSLALMLNEVGPLSVAVNSDVWQPYVGGVLTREACGGNTFADLNHAVQLVGYNTSAPIPYWIVRNTWTTRWGQHGYIYLEMGQNTCGLANIVTFPMVKGGGSQSTGMAGMITSKQQEAFQQLHRQAIALDENTVPTERQSAILP